MSLKSSVDVDVSSKKQLCQSKVRLMLMSVQRNQLSQRRQYSAKRIFCAVASCFVVARAAAIGRSLGALHMSNVALTLLQTKSSIEYVQKMTQSKKVS